MSLPRIQDLFYVFCCPRQTNFYPHTITALRLSTQISSTVNYNHFMFADHSCDLHVLHFFFSHIVVGTKKRMVKMPPQECACCSGDYSRPSRPSDYTALHPGTASEQSNHGTLGTMRYLSGQQEENHVKPPIMTVNHRDTDLNLETHE